MRQKNVFLAAVIGGFMILAGCSDNGETTSTDTTPAQSSPAQHEFNDVDVMFAQQMIPHHQQAVEMAQLAQDRADSEDVRELATQIEQAQGPEIETMTGWLEAWGEDLPEDMGDMGGMSTDEMPGMMTQQEIADLAAGSGADFDQMFLTMMIAHHEGAIEMARAEQTDGENPDAVALAEKIEADQTAEIDRMRELLGS